MVVGENGILNRATDASKKTNDAKYEEQKQFAIADATMSFENTEYKGVTIPAGFAPTRIEGEDSIEEGLVIIDSKGNEFVWIPVENIDNYLNANNLSMEWPSTAYNKDVDGKTDAASKGKIGWTNPTDQLEAGKMSIENYGGFYVSRYEAGVPSDATFYVQLNENTPEGTYFNATAKDVSINGLAPVSKKGNQVWNFIDQTNATTVSKNMYKDNLSLNSYLIDTNAWNYICEYKIKSKNDILDSKSYGNFCENITTDYKKIRGLFAVHGFDSDGNWVISKKYEYGNIPADAKPSNDEVKNVPRLELATGICDDFKTYNIYDMAGNLSEWTSETTSVSGAGEFATIRGGSFNNTQPIVYTHGGYNTYQTWVDYGFRVVLYLK